MKRAEWDIQEKIESQSIINVEVTKGGGAEVTNGAEPSVSCYIMNDICNYVFVYISKIKWPLGIFYREVLGEVGLFFGPQSSH